MSKVQTPKKVTKKTTKTNLSANTEELLAKLIEERLKSSTETQIEELLKERMNSIIEERFEVAIDTPKFRKIIEDELEKQLIKKMKNMIVDFLDDCELSCRGY